MMIRLAGCFVCFASRNTGTLPQWRACKDVLIFLVCLAPSGFVSKEGSSRDALSMRQSFLGVLLHLQKTQIGRQEFNGS